MNTKPIITILGGGNGGFAAAADLTLKGYEVRLLEAPEYSFTIQPVLESGGILLENPGVDGFSEGLAKVPLVTTDPRLAIHGADLILYIVPAFGERRFSQMIIPYIKPNQLVVFFCGTFGGALEFANTLRTSGVKELPLIAETEALLYGALKSGPFSVRLTGRKRGLAIAAFPSGNTPIVLERLSELFPDLTEAANVIETGLRNLNLVLHPPVCILNAGRLDPHAPKFRFYWEGVTEPIGKVVEALDRERVQVGHSIGVHLPACFERLLEWYGDQGAHGENLAQIMSTNPPYQSAMAPQSLDHRFITEDVPFGLIPLEQLAQSFNVPSPITSALITICNQLMGVDFRQQGRNLASLGLLGLNPTSILAMLT